VTRFELFEGANVCPLLIASRGASTSPVDHDRRLGTSHGHVPLPLCPIADRFPAFGWTANGTDGPHRLASKLIAEWFSGLLQALFNYLAAKNFERRTGKPGVFVLRIEDTDQKRSVDCSTC
jgi:hypothetical protein